jgi:hypothetical protein
MEGKNRGMLWQGHFLLLIAGEFVIKNHLIFDIFLLN